MKLLVSPILFLFLFKCYAQQSVIDSLEEKLVHASEKEKAGILNYLSKEHLSTGNSDKALTSAKRALEVAVRHNNKRENIKALRNIGAIYINHGEYQHTLNYYIQALKISEQINDKLEIANSYNGIGNVYMYLQNFKMCEENYGKAIELYKELKNKEKEAVTLGNMGYVRLLEGRYEEGLNYFLQQLERARQGKDKLTLATALHGTGEAYTQLNQSAKALSFYEKALEIDLELANKTDIAKDYLSIAGAYDDMKEWNNAKDYYGKALKILQELEDKHMIQMVHGELSNMYAKMGDYKKALESRNLSMQLKDSIFQLESTKQIAEMQTKYETNKKEQQIALLNKEKQKDKVIRYALMGGAVMFFFMTFLIYNRYRLKHKANQLLTAKNEIIEEQHKSIKDSINYAKRIQQAILPTDKEIQKAFSDFFILYKPKDVVSGDFYSFTQKEGKVILAAIDCTGHGVPGAFMSMIGNDQLNHIILEKGITKPSEILTQLNKDIKTALKQRDDTSETRDGMDIALCSIDLNNNQLEYAGAMRPLYYINGELKEMQGDKMPIGGTTDESYNYTNKQISIKKGDTIYLSSDGYADQFGGEKQKKFMTKNFKKLLLSTHNKPMKEQQKILDETFEKWKGSLEQIDDILVIGVRI